MSHDEPLADGWYLMSTRDLELELRRWRSRSAATPASNAVRLSSIEEALAYRNAGNLPDEHGRTLRLVLRVDDLDDLSTLDRKRLLYEPDFHDAPQWRRPGSRPVNVVPLRGPNAVRASVPAWWEDPGMAALEREWHANGTIGGLKVPAQYRGFVHKTVQALRSAGRDVTPDTVADSLARWLSPVEVERVRTALEEANASPRS